MVRPGQVPVKPPILVKLTAVVSPASFWAVALPLLDSGDDGGGDVASVLEVESRLALLYGCDGTPVDEVLPATPTPLLLKPDTLVAARHHGGSFHWFRAQVLDLELSTGLASLFLIDQGYAIKVHPETCVRQLPDGMKTSPKPLAFQILLAGLSPLSMGPDLEVGSGLHREASLSWSKAAKDTITDIWNRLELRLGVLRNQASDNLGRFHGVLELFGFSERVVLNEVLVQMGYAIKAGQFPSVHSIGFRQLSICGSEHGGNSHDSARRNEQFNPLRSLDPDAPVASAASGTAAAAATTPGETGDWRTTMISFREKLAKKLGKESGSSGTEDSFSGEDWWWTGPDSASDRTVAEDHGDVRVVVMPGGMDIGKAIEARIKTAKSLGEGSVRSFASMEPNN